MNEDDDEKPISQRIPKPGKSGVTLINKVKLPQWVIDIIIPESDFMKLVYVLLGMFVMFAIIGAWEFGFCKARNESCTFYECITHTEPNRPVRHK